MNDSARNKILIVLIGLLVVCLGGLVYWYFFMYRCTAIPSEFESFGRFINNESCTQKDINVKGIMYNIEVGEESVTFDFNLWDIENRKNVYIEDVVLPREEGVDISMYGMDLSAIKAVTLNIVLTDEEAIPILPVNLSVSEWGVEPIVLTKEGKEEYLNILYTAINVSPTGDVFTWDFGDGEEREVLIENAYYDEDGNLQQTPFFLSTPSVLYRLLMDAKLFEFCKENELGGICENYQGSFDDYAEEFINEIVRLRNLNADGAGMETQKSFTFAGSVAEFSLNCTYISELVEYSESKGEILDLLEGACSVDYVNNYVKNSLEGEFRYSLEDFPGSVSIGRIVERSTDEETTTPIAYFASMISDTYFSSKLYGVNLGQEGQRKVNLAVVNHFLNSPEYTFEDIATLAYSSSKTGDIIDKDYYESNLLSVRGILELGVENILSLVENYSYSAFLCLDAFDDEYTDDLEGAILLRHLYINMYEEENMFGVWNVEDGSYNIIENVSVFNSLLDYELLDE